MRTFTKFNLWVLVLTMAGLSLALTGCPDPETKNPEISSLTADPTSVQVNGASTLRCVASHPDGLPMEYIWEATAGSISGSGSTVTWNAPASEGQYSVICKVVDSNGKQDTASVTITVNPVPPSVIYLDTTVALSANTTVEGRAYCANLSFTPDEGVAVNITATGPANMDIDLWLYDPYGTEVANATSSTLGSETILSFITALDESYRLKVCDYTEIGGTVHVLVVRE